MATWSAEIVAGGLGDRIVCSMFLRLLRFLGEKIGVKGLDEEELA